MSQPCCTKEVEIGDRRLAARQDDKIGDRQRLARTDEHEPHGRLELSGSKSSKLAMRASIGTAMVNRAFRPRLLVAEAERVLGRQARRLGEERQEAEGAPARMRFERRHAAQEQVRVAAELVDDEADDHRGVVGRERDLRSENLGENAAAVDVADQRDRTIRGAREAHVGDVALAQVDLGRAARALDEHEIGGLASRGA